MTRTYVILTLLAFSVLMLARLWFPGDQGVGDELQNGADGKRIKLYWFIPDGLRADPEVFKLFEWARRGELPNIRKMMERGAYGYSIPVFPGHTPTNFATLLTGTKPATHGVADGPMRFEGYPLEFVAKSGFSSHAKRVPPIWYTLETSGHKVTLLSVPGSTPPELSRGITIKGRWGGWGIDFPAAIFHTEKDAQTRIEQNLDNRLFGEGVVLTHYLPAGEPSGWTRLPTSYSPPREITISNWGEQVFALIVDSTNDHEVNYDRILFSKNKSDPWADLSVGEWSDWLPTSLSYQTNNDYKLSTPKKSEWERELTEIGIDTQVKIRVIRLGEKDFFRIRFYYNALNRFLAKPSGIAQELITSVGPMVDFPDNFPPQLIYYLEDKQAFFEESLMSLAWHRRAAGHLIEETRSDVIIHDIYTPNQFLTSRWWMKYLDPSSAAYPEVTENERRELWAETKSIYKGIDAILGRVLESVDADTYVVLSSDHGIIPLETRVNINNLFAREGLLEYDVDPETGYYKIDWANTRAVFLKMDNVYVNPNGLGGNYSRASGEDYLVLRNRVKRLLENLRDAQGRQPLARVTAWENAEFIDLPKDRIGDLIIANEAGFGWSEEINEGLEIFEPARTSGYKQAVIPGSHKGMWTPFVIMGPGVKQGHQISSPINHVDQYPTIMSLLGEEVPDFVEGAVVKELLR